MSMTLLPLHDCLGAAQRDALRIHGTAPPPAWQARAPRAWRLWLLAGVVLSLGATTAVLAARRLSPAPAATRALESAALPPVTAAMDTAPAQPLLVPAPPVVPAAALREQRVERVGDAWVIDVAGVSRAQAAQRLAALTGGVLLERPELLAQTPALTLSWRGRDAGEAWRQLLGDEVGYAVQCAAQACRGWVLAPAERSAAAGAATGTVAVVAVAATAATAATAERNSRAALPSPQAIAPSTHEAAPAPMQPDPPGLFPSPAEAD